MGTARTTALRCRLALTLLLFDWAWILVDGPAAHREAHVKIIDPTSVPNWLDGREVLVRESVDTRSSLREKVKQQQQYVLYGIEGWERYRLSRDTGLAIEGATEILIGSAPYSEAGRVYVSRSGVPMPPVFQVKSPFRRYIAHQLARHERVVANIESDRDALQRNTSYPKLVLSAQDELFDKLVKQLKKGSNVLQELPSETGGEHRYISADPSGIEVSTATLEQKRKAFRETAFRLYDAEGRLQQTATAAAMKRSSGLAAALALLAETMAEAESTMLHLLAQAYDDRPGAWAETGCTWPTDYSSVDVGSPANAR